MVNVNFKPSKSYIKKALNAFDTLQGRQGRGNDFLGWLDLPSDTPESIVRGCEDIAKEWKDKGVQVAVVIGIGGSYLGAKAALEALSHSFGLNEKGIHVVFAGFNLSEEYHAELIDYIQDKSVAAVVISKSGTTTEPAVAFRVIKEHIEERYGKSEAASRIVAVTDKARGALKSLSDQEGYRTFVIPDNVAAASPSSLPWACSPSPWPVTISVPCSRVPPLWPAAAPSAVRRIPPSSTPQPATSTTMPARRWRS